MDGSFNPGAVLPNFPFVNLIAREGNAIPFVAENKITNLENNLLSSNYLADARMNKNRFREAMSQSG